MEQYESSVELLMNESISVGLPRTQQMSSFVRIVLECQFSTAPLQASIHLGPSFLNVILYRKHISLVQSGGRMQ